MTPLAKKIAGGNGAPASAVKSPLAAVLERGARGELVDLPVLGPAWLQLIGHEDVQAIESDVMKRMAALGLELTPLNVLSYDAERAVLTLARAVRSPDDRAAPFGTEAEWGKVDSDTIAACWHIFGDLRERLSPLDVEIPPMMRTEILAAIAKKNTMLLRSFGLSVLVSFMASTEFPPETSPSPKSSDGESSPVTS